MSIRRGPRPEQRFYTVDKSLSENERLSWGARGLLIFLLGKPDNWEISVTHLIKQTANAEGKSSGRDAVRMILKELERVGYLVADHARNSTGKFSGMAYTVYEQPITPQTENPSPDAPQTDYPSPAKPAPANHPLTSTDKTTSTDNPAKGSPNGSPGAMDFGDHAASSFSSIHNNSSNGTGESCAATSADTMAEPTIQSNRSGDAAAVGKEAKKSAKDKAGKAAAIDVAMLTIPEWLDEQLIVDFIESRREIKKPATQRAVSMLIKQMVDLRAKGYDSVSMLQKTIVAGWQGLPDRNIEQYQTAKTARRFPDSRQKFDPFAFTGANTNHGPHTGGNFHEHNDRNIIDVTPE